MKNHPSSVRLALCVLAAGFTLVTPPARAVEYVGFVGPVTVDTRLLLVPLITEDPRSVTNLSGTPATFTVSAAGMAPLVYQWRKDGLPLAEGGNVSGARSNVLTLASVQWADAGQYSVVITNIAGSVTSVVARLTVWVPPIITVQPQSQTVFEGTNVSFVVAASGTVPMAYQWFFGATPLTKPSRARPQPVPTTRSWPP